jgi:hypothetical protein
MPDTAPATRLVLDWSDQPKEIEEGERIAYFNTTGYLVGIYRTSRRHYVTIGNLFGSQTISTNGPDGALCLLGAAMTAISMKVTIPFKTLREKHPQYDITLHE